MELVSMIQNVNYLAVLVAAIVSFAAGMLWYSPAMFGDAWREDTAAGRVKGHSMGTVQVLSFLGMLFGTWVFAMLLQSAGTMAEAVNFAIFIAIFFVTALAAKNYLYEAKPCRLFLINAGYDILALVIAALILVSWN